MTLAQSCRRSMAAQGNIRSSCICGLTWDWKRLYRGCKTYTPGRGATYSTKPHRTSRISCCETPAACIRHQQQFHFWTVWPSWPWIPESCRSTDRHDLLLQLPPLFSARPLDSTSSTRFRQRTSASSLKVSQYPSQLQQTSAPGLNGISFTRSSL